MDHEILNFRDFKILLATQDSRNFDFYKGILQPRNFNLETLGGIYAC